MVCSTRIYIAAIAAICCALPATPASATGTINIQHKNGAIKTYRDVEIKILSGSMFLTTEDGDGTIVVTRAACSYQGQVIVCLPTLAALVQNGTTSALNLKNGTIYLNYTGAPQPLSRSSAKLAANSAMLALTLQNGTFINLSGRIDEVIKQ